MDLRRIKQVLKYASTHSAIVKNQQNEGFLYQLTVFADMLFCFLKYKMWTTQYLNENFHNINKVEKRKIGNDYLQKGIERDKWQNDFIANRRFLNKYSKKKYELPNYREKRNEAYRQRYNMGKNCFVEYGVELTRQHYLPGSIEIGDNVILTKNVFIDYSGNVRIGSNVQIADNVKIITHDHLHFKSSNIISDFKNNCIPSELIIGEGALIGTSAIILSNCKYIGKFARIGAGSVVTKNVPDNALVGGVPANIIRYNL
jgi:acetyltransferase-like isoleucine patch superfamily enzyme